MNATSLWHLDPHTSIFKKAPIYSAGNTVSLTSQYSLVSLGTERIILSGKVPAELFKEMTVPYMEGSFSFPIKYGYSLVGVSDDMKAYHVMHPHQDRVSVRMDSCLELPDSIPHRRAALISNLETACNAYWDGQASAHDHILVVGFGVIGAAIATWHSLKGHHHITVIEKNDYRKSLAKGMGFEVSDMADQSQIYSLAFHCTATAEGLQTCIDHMAFEGRIIEMSWYGDQEISLHLGHYFHYQRLRIFSSQVSHIPGHLQTTQTYLSRKQEVLKMLIHDIWDKLLGIEVPFDQLIPWYDKIRSGQLNEISLLVKY